MSLDVVDRGLRGRKVARGYTRDLRVRAFRTSYGNNAGNNGRFQTQITYFSRVLVQRVAAAMVMETIAGVFKQIFAVTSDLQLRPPKRAGEEVGDTRLVGCSGGCDEHKPRFFSR